jgi:copper chaperone CopZ
MDAPVPAPAVTLSVSGMSCGGCEGAVRNALEAVAGVDRAEVTRDRGGDKEALLAAVRATGKEVSVLEKSG